MAVVPAIAATGGFGVMVAVVDWYWTGVPKKMSPDPELPVTTAWTEQNWL